VADYRGFFRRHAAVYDRTLHFTLRHRAATMAVSLIVWLRRANVPHDSKGFLPDEDQGFIFVFTRDHKGFLTTAWCGTSWR